MLPAMARVDVGVGRMRLFGQERRGLHDLADLAVAALGDVARHPRALHADGSVGAQPFDA